LDRTLLIHQKGRRGNYKKDQILIIVTFHPAFFSLRDVVGRFQTIFGASEEHRRVFKEKPSVLFRRRPNLKDNIVRAKLPWIHTEVVKGCVKCGKSRCQVCSCISEGNSFSCYVSGKQYSISSSFNCDSSGVVYLLGCKVCGKQYVGSTFTSFRTRFNNYTSSSRKFSYGMSVAQAELFRHFTEVNLNGCIEVVTHKIIGSFWGV